MNRETSWVGCSPLLLLVRVPEVAWGQVFSIKRPGKYPYSVAVVRTHQGSTRRTMNSEFATNKYEVHLPVAVWDSSLAEGRGVTEYMSNHDICFSVDNPSAVTPGTPVMLFVSLPSEVTDGSKVQLRVSGRIVRAERDAVSDAGRVNLVAVMDWYDFIRADASNEHRSFKLQCAASAGSSSVRVSAQKPAPETHGQDGFRRITH